MAGKNRMSSACGPPRLAEAFLAALLPRADRLTVTGDLREEYIETILPENGRFRANLWFVLQAASLAPHSLYKEGPMRAALLLASVFSVVCSSWLAAMEAILRHPGYVSRLSFDAEIALIPLITIAVILLHAGRRAEIWLRPLGCIPICIAVWAFVRNALSPHFEGFVLIVSLALALQGILMFTSLGRNRAIPPGVQGIG
jgi:hypothetical protein